MSSDVSERLRNLHAAFPAETVGEFERDHLKEAGPMKFGERLVQWSCDFDGVAVTYYESRYAVDALRYSPDRGDHLQLCHIESVATPAEAVALAHHVMQIASKASAPASKVLQEYPHVECVVTVE